MPAVSKARPISQELLRKVRRRKTQICPYCGTGNPLWDSWRLLMPEPMFKVDCFKCGLSFWLPWSRKFDPTTPETVEIAIDRWTKCPHCWVKFVFRRKYEQCPGCGKILIGNDSVHDFKLRNNEAEALAAIAKFQEENRKQRWQVWK